MRTLLKHLLQAFLFLLLSVALTGCRTVQVQCATPTCTNLSSRLSKHDHVLTEIRATENGEERAFTYALTELKGQGWQIMERGKERASLKLISNSAKEGSVHITVLHHIAVQRGIHPDDNFRYMPVVLETMQTIATMEGPIRTVYLTLGAPMSPPKSTPQDTLIEFDPVSGGGCAPHFSPSTTGDKETPVQVSCHTPVVFPPGSTYGAWAIYIRAVRDGLRPLLQQTIGDP